MDRFVAWIVSLSVALSFMAVSSAAQTNTFRGEITDEHLNCVQAPVKAVEGVTDRSRLKPRFPRGSTGSNPVPGTSSTCTYDDP